MITPQTRLRLGPRARFRRFEDDGIVLHQVTAEALVVSDVATRLLELSDGTRSLADCAVALSEEFDAPPEVIEGDLIRFADELVESGIAVVVER
jgi:hypothetical protein